MNHAGTVEPAGRPSLTTAGMIIFLGSETMFFGGLFAAYFTLRANSAVWPGEDVHLELGQGTLFTLVLLASSLTVHQAVRAAGAGSRPGVLRWLAITMLLGAAFLGNQAAEWSALDFTIASHPYGSIFYLATGFHGLHVLGGLATMALLSTFLRRGGRLDPATVESVSLYWHFVDVVWVLLFATLFVVR